MVIPGGESTTIGKLLVEWDMLETAAPAHPDGMPVYGSCAGLILLFCKEIEGSDQPRLGVLTPPCAAMPSAVRVDSFETDLHIDGLAGELCGPCSSVRRSSAAWAKACGCWPV